MHRYGVSIPFTGYYYLEVESEEELDDDEAFDVACEQLEREPSPEEFVMDQNVHKYVTRGNVCSAVLREFDVEYLGEE